MPRNGRPCDGSTSVSGGSVSNAASESRKRAQRIAVRLDGPDADVGADLRQQHVARDQHAALAREYSDACSGEWPWPSMTRHVAPPASTHVAVEQPVERLAAARARRGGSGCRARRARRRARRPCRGGERARSSRATRSRACSPAIACAVRYSACVIATGAPKRCDEPRGVAEVIGMVMRRDDPRDRLAPRASSAKWRSHSARVGGVAEAAVDERRSRRRSSSSHRLMWSSANGSGIRSQSTPRRDLDRLRPAPAARRTDSRARRASRRSSEVRAADGGRSDASVGAVNAFCATQHRRRIARCCQADMVS